MSSPTTLRAVASPQIFTARLPQTARSSRQINELLNSIFITLKEDPPKSVPLLQRTISQGFGSLEEETCFLVGYSRRIQELIQKSKRTIPTTESEKNQFISPEHPLR